MPRTRKISMLHLRAVERLDEPLARAAVADGEVAFHGLIAVDPRRQSVDASGAAQRLILEACQMGTDRGLSAARARYGFHLSHVWCSLSASVAPAAVSSRTTRRFGHACSAMPVADRRRVPKIGRASCRGRV